MNSTYYLEVPGSNFPTAEAEASSTKHARTAYLDYLSRNGYIGWGDRQAWRQRIVTKRMQPGEIRTQVQLDYDGIGIVEPETEVEAPEQLEERQEYDESVRPPHEEAIEMEYKDGGPASGYQTRQTSVLPARNPFGDSPIAKLSKQSKGM